MYPQHSTTSKPKISSALTLEKNTDIFIVTMIDEQTQIILTHFNNSSIQCK